jgi:hypothetical protein
MLSLSQQSVAQLGGPLSVLARQKRDHVRLDQLLDQLSATAPQDQGPVLREIYRLVFPHAFAEEGVLWPVIRRVLPDGHGLTLQIEREHQEVNELVAVLDGLAPDEPRRAAVLRRLVDVLREDVRDEEDVLLPRLQERLSTRQLRALGIAWEVLRRTAPTRAHPVVSRRPPGNTASALPLSDIDRSRDRLDSVSPGGRAGPASAASRRLGDVARRLEHVPLFTRGEDESTSRTP